MAGYPHTTATVHQFMHNLSTGSVDNFLNGVRGAPRELVHLERGEVGAVPAMTTASYQRRASSDPPSSVISWRAAASAVGLRAIRSVTRARARLSSPLRAAAARRARSMTSRWAWLPPTAL